MKVIDTKQPMKIALAQINTTVGDIAYNSELIRQNIKRAKEAGAKLVIFPEMAIIGFPPRDLLLKKQVIAKSMQAAEKLAHECQAIDAIIGAPWLAQTAPDAVLHNAALFCSGGKIASTHYKSVLASYDVFDECRYFAPAKNIKAATCNGQKLNVTLGGFLWDDNNFEHQIENQNQAGTDILINITAAPFTYQSREAREKSMAHIAKQTSKPILFCNQVGGNDELIFDGNSCAFNNDGKIIARAKDFKEDLVIVDSDEKKVSGTFLSGGNNAAGNNTGGQATSGTRKQKVPDTFFSPKRDIEAVYHALVLGVRDYCKKSGFSSIVLGLSGGIDSALAACIAVDALGEKNVTGIAMPSRYSSSGSKSDAEKLAKNLQIDFRQVEIETVHGAFENLLAPLFEGKEKDTSEENIQARIRGNILMAFSNKFGSLLITTGNKSEAAVGYCTLYGDMAGGLAVLSDLPKTQVYKMSNWINDHLASPLLKRYKRKVIPVDTIEKPPSAELRADQKDEDSLPAYEVLDKIIELYVEKLESPEKIIEQTGFDQDEVKRITTLIDRNEYKRKQMPPGLKVTSCGFGSGRRMPIAQNFK